MRRLLLTENITADGRIEIIDEWFGPSPEGGIEDWLDATELLGASSDAVLLGRQTFEDFRGYWPQHTDEPAGAYLDQALPFIHAAAPIVRRNVKVSSKIDRTCSISAAEL